jgi:hypothetical protein
MTELSPAFNIRDKSYKQPDFMNAKTICQKVKQNGIIHIVRKHPLGTGI